MKRFLSPGRVVAVFLVVAFFCNGAVARAATISQWTFETSPPADLTNSANGPAVAADVGLGTATASGTHASAATDWTTPVGNGSANSLSANNWAVGDYWQFQLSTVGVTNIGVAWDQTKSASGPGVFDFAYSTDGVTFTVVLNNYTVPAVTWSSGSNTQTTAFSVSLASIAAVANAPTLTFRLTAESAGTDDGGTNRIDNFTVTGTEIAVPPGVPESGATIVVFGLSLIALFGKKLKS
jgi:hypothetical protein